MSDSVPAGLRPSPDEGASILSVAVHALEPYDIPTGRAWSDAERIEPAEAVLRALWDAFGLDVGFHLADAFGATHDATSEGAGHD